MGKIGYKRFNRTGHKFGRLTILGYSNLTDKYVKKIAVCKCECGATADIMEESLIGGFTKSCGCLKTEVNKIKGDGRTKEKLYRTYHSMKQRCYNENTPNYRRYGLRGIMVCKEWMESYSVFREWAYSNGYNEGLEIDRIDNDGNYEAVNCRWVTKKVNSNNNSRTVFITHNGETKPLTEWAQIYNITPDKLRSRYCELKIPFEEAVKDKLVRRKQSV